MSTVFHGWRRNATVATVATLAVIVACAWYRNYLDTRVIEAARSMYSHDLPSPEAEPVLPAQEPQVGGVDAGEGEDLPDIVGTVERVVYDRPSQSLFVRLSIEDRSARSLFVVANEFCFKNLYGGDHCQLNVDVQQEKMSIDLSQAFPNVNGMNYYRGEDGSLGPVPAVVEIAAHGYVTYTLSFHFPPWLDTHLSNVEVIDVPSGVKDLSVKIGYSQETFEAFFQRDLKGWV